MKHVLTVLAVTCGWLVDEAGAFVFDNADCAFCHASSSQVGAIRDNALSVLGSGLTNLDADRNDGVSRGSIPFYLAEPGETISLTMEVLDGADRYAVSIANFEASAVTGPTNAASLAGYVHDPTWVTKKPAPNPIFYTNVNDTVSALDWPRGQTAARTYSFDLELSSSTPLATYELEFTVAGILSSQPRRKFVESQYFYLQVVAPTNGDFNGDGVVDGADLLVWQRGSLPGGISPSDLEEWEANYGNFSNQAAALAQVPEPPGKLLIVAAVAALALRVRRGAT